MGSSYPALRRPETFRGPPVAANDNWKTPNVSYGRKPPMRLTPANDNATSRARVQFRGMLRSLVALPVQSILADAAHVLASSFTDETVEEGSSPGSPASGWFWSQWQTLTHQCAVPGSYVWSSTVTNNCAAPATPAPLNGTPSYGTNAFNQEFWTWAHNKHEFINPTAGWRYRQRYSWRLVHSPINQGAAGWLNVYPEGAPMIEPGFWTPSPLAAPLPKPAPAPWHLPRSRPQPVPEPWQGPSAGPWPAARPQPVTVIRVTPQGITIHKERPKPPGPPQGAKETKSMLQKNGWLAGGMWLATEGADVINAIHDALKPECKAKPKWKSGDKGGYGRLRPGDIGSRSVTRGKGHWQAPSMTDKMEAVYNNFDCLDIAQMWSNLLNEQVEDMAYGQIGQSLKSGPLNSPQVGPAI